jgi:MOSC domain-containing protein YiiM
VFIDESTVCECRNANEILFNGQTVTTAIFKNPVKDPIKLRKLNLDGDRQADLTVHGGVHKAVYSYPSEHYGHWRKEYPNMNIVWGMFGENFTTAGLMEDAVNIGDKFHIGSAKVVATQPRMPCYKLGVRFGCTDVIRRFIVSGRPGIYFKVVEEGEVKTGDKIKVIKRDKNNITVKDIVRLYVIKNDTDIETMRRAIKVRALPEGWRYEFQQKIEQLERTQ